MTINGKAIGMDIASVTVEEKTKPDVNTYGPTHAPRVKWLCRCGKRNDQRLLLPIAAIEQKWCKHCKQRTLISFNVGDCLQTLDMNRAFK